MASNSIHEARPGLQMLCMTGAIALLLFSGVPLAASVAQSGSQPGLVTLDSLWEARRHKEARAAGIQRKGVRKHTEHVALASGGALLRSEKEGSLLQGSDSLQTAEPAMAGAVARQFIMRDGLHPVERASSSFAPAAELSARLHEIEGRCGWILEKKWALLDAALDSDGGHHWVLRGPSADGSKQLLLHVKSEAFRGGHAPLSFSPMKLCPKVSATLLDSQWPAGVAGVPDPNALAPDADIGEADQVMLSNDNVVKSIKVIQDKVISESRKCGEFQLVENATALAATSEVADALNIMVTMRLTPVQTDPAISCAGAGADCIPPPVATYHVFSVDWKCVNNCENGLTPEFGPLPFDNQEQDEIGWCDLMSKSTEENLGNLVQTQGHSAPDIWLSKLGLLNVYRDYRGSEADMLFEKQDSGTRESADCIPVARLPDTYDIRARNPLCLNRDTVEDQGPCASCWAFATASSLAARACIKYPRAMIGPGYRRKMFSKQQYMSCNTAQVGCSGGEFPNAFEEAKKGIVMDEDYPYYPGHSREFPWSGIGERCKWGLVTKPWIVTAHYPLQHGTIGQIQQEIFCKGPVTAGMTIYSNFFSFWAEDKTRTMLKADLSSAIQIGGHAVTLLGWGHLDPGPNGAYGTGTKFWECMNSWGPSWGNNGFFRMERGVNIAGMETTTVHAGDIAPTQGSWMYDSWSTCDVSTDRKNRPIRCMSNTGEAVQTSDTCPILGFNSNPYTFPNPLSVHYQEIEAMKPCTDGPAGCTMYSACNGNGAAALLEGSCACTCYEWYEGDSCERCTPDASGWPRCRQMCVNADCNDHGTVSGNRWLTEFGDARDSCDCECGDGFAGDTCERCANPATHTYPNCFGSISPFPSTTETTSSFITTTLPPCRVHRGPIELMPPAGLNWLVLNCDVRLRDCEPDRVKCTSTSIMQQYCAWAVTDEFPDGQCMSRGNSSQYHIRIPGTDRDGEIVDGTVAKDNFTMSKSTYVAPTPAPAAAATPAAAPAATETFDNPAAAAFDNPAAAAFDNPAAAGAAALR